MADPYISDEPASGWLRFEVEGEKPYFKSPVPRMVIRDRVKLAAYLEKEHAEGRMLDVVEDMFSFKRRLGLKRKKMLHHSHRKKKKFRKYQFQLA